MTPLDEDVGDLLRHLDHPVPTLRATDVMRRVTTRRWEVMGRAAAVLLVIGLGGVAWAAPGSPLPRLVASVSAWITRTSAAPVTPVAPPIQPVAAPTPTAFSGVAVAPGRRLIILFRATQVSGTARVSVEDVPDVSVRTLVGGAAFTSTNDELIVDNRGSVAPFEIVIPRAAAQVEIRVEGRRVFFKDGARVSAPGATQTGTTYEIALLRLGANRP